MSEAKKHIVVLPFPAFGHITPMLELSKKLAKHHHVTFAVSEYKLAEIRNRQLISAEEEEQIRLLGLKDGLVEDYDKDLKPKQLAEAVQQMVPAQRELLEQMPVRGGKSLSSHLDLESVDAVIADICFSAPAPICKARDIPCCAFSCAAAWTVVGMLAINENTPACEDEEFYKGEESDDAKPNFAEKVPESLKRWLVSCNTALSQVTSIAINSFEDLEPEVKNQMAYVLPSIVDLPVHYVGPLFPTPRENDTQKTMEHQVALWLNGHQDRSVVYVSFGSMAIPVPQQIGEIAKTLLDLKRPFIWSLRTSQHEYLPEAVRAAVAKQFETTDTPFLVLPWAPQKTILAHKATRLFVSHCGWNSTLEGISSGVPIVAWPMFGDQHLNAVMVAKTGVGISIPNICVRGQRIVSQSEMTGAINTVAGWDQQENSFYQTVQALSRKAAQAVSQDGKSTRDFQALVKF